MCLRPALRPRRDQHYRDKAIAASRHGPTHSVPRGLSTRGNFGARSHGISTRCLRFAPWVTPKDARLASGCGPGSTRRDWLPAGFRRKVSEMATYIASPFPKLLGANADPLSSPVVKLIDEYFPFIYGKRLIRGLGRGKRGRPLSPHGGKRNAQGK